MELTKMQNKVSELNKEATRKFVGKYFTLPESLLEDNTSTKPYVCKVTRIDLQEGNVDLDYEDDGEELWTVIKIYDFDRAALPID